VLSGRSEDADILWEVALRECCHYAARARTSDVQANVIPDDEHVPNPGILREVILAVCGRHYDVRAKPSNFETALGIQRPQPIERGCGQQMYQRVTPTPARGYITA
jgi:hypothetical protein